MFALFAFPFFALIFMTANASWSIIIFASLSIIILWVFYWCSVIKWLIL